MFKVLSHLSSGDVTTNELFYHKNCLVNFNNQYQSEMNKEKNMNNSTQTTYAELQKELRINQVIFHIMARYNCGETSFLISELENKYLEMLEHDGISQSSHSSRFSGRQRYR